MKYSKKLSSFDIIEKSFGGTFPPSIKLESPPRLTVTISEDSFNQRLIRVPAGIIKVFNFSLVEIKKTLREEYFSGKRLVTIQNILVTTLSSIVLIFNIPKMIKRLVSVSPFEANGYISPIKANHIYINSKNIKKDDADVNKVISHENIHVLQTHRGDLKSSTRSIDIERVNQYCKRYTKVKAEYQLFIRYLLSKAEVEARVHEIVSAFYTATGKFPCTRKEFIVCLVYSNDVLKNLSLKLQANPSESKKILRLLEEIEVVAADMSIHSSVKTLTKASSDFCVIFFAINSFEKLFNFISYELPIYYCNVLKLYGSESFSSKLESEINHERELLAVSD